MSLKRVVTRLTLGLAVLAGLFATACAPPVPAEPEILEFGTESKGTLSGGAERVFLLPVEADGRYAISLVGSAGTLGAPDLRATLRGATAPEDIVWDVRGLSLFRPEVIKGFRALESGHYEFHLENRTEGLTLEQGFLQFLLGDASLAQYRIRAFELGIDDHGRNPSEATRLADDGAPVLGTIVFGKDYDFFVLPVAEGQRYELTFEVSGTAKLATSFVDRFDEFNFEAATPGGVQFQLQSDSGVPAVKRFTALRNEDILLGVAPGPDNLLAGIFGVPAGFGSYPIQYAISVSSSPGGALVSGAAFEDVVPTGDVVRLFIDVPAGTTRFVTELTGPTSLIAYINPDRPGSVLEFQDFVSPSVEGETVMVTTAVAPDVARYYFTVTTLSGLPADFSLRVTLD
jgi:hypothetical protein